MAGNSHAGKIAAFVFFALVIAILAYFLGPPLWGALTFLVPGLAGLRKTSGRSGDSLAERSRASQRASEESASRLQGRIEGDIGAIDRLLDEGGKGPSGQTGGT